MFRSSVDLEDLKAALVPLYELLGLSHDDRDRDPYAVPGITIADTITFQVPFFAEQAKMLPDQFPLRTESRVSIIEPSAFITVKVVGL